ncbi:beta-adducin isoform X1, partial [Tachysurus ichikawai]
GYRTGYAYRFPVLLERSRTRREVEVPATVTSFSFDDEGKRVQVRLQPHAHKQQMEKTRWLNTPNTYQKVNQDQASPGHRTTVRTTPAFTAMNHINVNVCLQSEIINTGKEKVKSSYKLLFFSNKPGLEFTS